MTPAQRLIAVVALAIIAAAVAVAREERARRRETVAPANSLEGLDIEAILWAIRQRESGDDPRAIGRRGERSAYQFMRGTWTLHTRAPFLLATMDPARAERVARIHLEFLIRELADRGFKGTPDFIAAAWRFGPGFALDTVRTEYAQAIANLYFDRVAEKGKK